MYWNEIITNEKIDDLLQSHQLGKITLGNLIDFITSLYSVVGDDFLTPALLSHGMWQVRLRIAETRC